MNIFKLNLIIIVLFTINSCMSSKKTNSENQNNKNTKNAKVEIQELIISHDYVLPEKTDYSLNSISLNDSIITINISYIGGCGEHKFELYFNEMYAKSLPVQAGLYLKHDSNNETCNKKIDKTLYFNISKSKHPKYKETYIKVYGIDYKLMYKY